MRRGWRKTCEAPSLQESVQGRSNWLCCCPPLILRVVAIISFIVFIMIEKKGIITKFFMGNCSSQISVFLIVGLNIVYLININLLFLLVKY